jgi:hypothetical protein
VTKQELEELVTRAFALYNQTLLDIDRKVILRAWYDMLEDLPFEDTQKVLLNYAAVSQFMPKPGDIRRAYINTHNKVGEAPPPLAAWATLIGQIKLANSGLPIEMGLHPCLVKTMELLGDTVYGLHNTTDQINFIKTYEQVVLEFQQQKYKIL